MRVVGMLLIVLFVVVMFLGTERFGHYAWFPGSGLRPQSWRRK
jgi:hypothetical protein